MTDQDYAEAVYREVFNTRHDDDDANPARILEAITMLTEREQIAVKCRLKDGLTWRKVGNELGVTDSRAQQIYLKAIRKLRHPARARDMSVTKIVEQRDRLAAKMYEFLDTIERLQLENDKLRDGILVPNTVIPEDAELSVRARIEELALSVRSYNCLKRAGKDTVADVLNTTYRELFRIRNLGRKSAEEVVERMRRAGYVEWADSMKWGNIHGGEDE